MQRVRSDFKGLVVTLNCFFEFVKSKKCQPFVVKRSEVVWYQLESGIVMIDSFTEFPVFELIVC